MSGGARTRQLVVALLMVAVSGCQSDSSGSTTDAVWYLDPAEPVSEASESISVLVNRVACSSGETGPVSLHAVTIDEDQIVITFRTEPLPAGFYECPGNEQVPAVVDLGEAVGSRLLIDGTCLDHPELFDTGSCQPSQRWPATE